MLSDVLSLSGFLLAGIFAVAYFYSALKVNEKDDKSNIGDSLLNTIPMLRFDRRGEVLSYNEPLKLRLNQFAEVGKEQRLADFFPGAQLEGVITKMLASCNRGLPWSGELQVRRPGGVFIFQACAQALNDSNSEQFILFLFEQTVSSSASQGLVEPSQMIKQIPLPAAVVENNHLTKVNTHLGIMLTSQTEDLQGMHVLSLFEPSVAKKHLTQMEFELQAKASAAFQAEVQCKGGELKWCDCIILSQQSSHAQIWMFNDATRSRTITDEVRQASIVFESANDGILIMDPDLVITMCNPAITRLTQFDVEELKRKKLHFLGGTKHKPDFYNTMLEKLKHSGAWHGEMWYRRRNNQFFAVWFSITAVKDINGNLLEYVGIAADITERKESEKQIVYQANFDELTGLPNRHFFMTQLDELISQARREGTLLAFLYLDLDRFKNVNETLGHNVGDQLLKRVANTLGACLRDSDILARFGGDEFVMVLTPIYGNKNVSSVAQTVIDYLSKPIMLDGYEVIIGASIGISVFPNDGNDQETLWKNADIALATAKEQGRNNFQFFTQSLFNAAQERLSIEQELRLAIERNELILNYQPQYGFNEKGIFGVEVLLRWQTQSEGMISPARFIPIAEDTGLIVPIGEWVLKTACRQYKKWQGQQIAPSYLAINVSGRQFCTENFVNTILQVLSEEKVAAENIELELTESILMDDEQRVINTLNELRTLGFKLSIDDFGTGYSSLSYLKRFPIDTLKVDQSFVRETPENEEDTAIVKTIIDMAHTLNMGVIAEGVEKEAQLQFLRSIGCDVIQGYYYSKPLDAESCTQFLAKASLQRQSTPVV